MLRIVYSDKDPCVVCNLAAAFDFLYHCFYFFFLKKKDVTVVSKEAEEVTVNITVVTASSQIKEAKEVTVVILMQNT